MLSAGTRRCWKYLQSQLVDIFVLALKLHPEGVLPSQRGAVSWALLVISNHSLMQHVIAGMTCNGIHAGVSCDGMLHQGVIADDNRLDVQHMTCFGA
jgi:hypothetical protein